MWTLKYHVPPHALLIWHLYFLKYDLVLFFLCKSPNIQNHFWLDFPVDFFFLSLQATLTVQISCKRNRYLSTKAFDFKGVVYIIININMPGYFAERKNRLHINASSCNFSALPGRPWRRMSVWPSTGFRHWHLTSPQGVHCPCSTYSTPSSSSAYQVGLADHFDHGSLSLLENQTAASPLSPANSPVELARCLNFARPLWAGKWGEDKLFSPLALTRYTPWNSRTCCSLAKWVLKPLLASW